MCATSKQSADTVVLSSYFSRRRGSDLQAITTIWAAARATSAASSFFNPIKIRDESFVDGATPANNPINELWTEAYDTFGVRNNDNWRLEDNILCLVSIGTGMPSVKPFGDNLKSVGQALLAIAIDTEKCAENFQRHHLPLAKQHRYCRFNVLRGLEDVGLEDASKIDRIIGATRRYIQTQNVFEQFEACSERLRERDSRSISA